MSSHVRKTRQPILCAHETVSGDDIKYLFEHGVMPEPVVAAAPQEEVAPVAEPEEPESSVDDEHHGDLGGGLLPNPA